MMLLHMIYWSDYRRIITQNLYAILDEPNLQERVKAILERLQFIYPLMTQLELGKVFRWHRLMVLKGTISERMFKIGKRGLRKSL